MGHEPADLPRPVAGPPVATLAYATPGGIVTLERHADGVRVRLPPARLWVALATGVPALLISLGLLVGLAVLLYGLTWQSPASLGAAVCVSVFAIPLALSALWAAIHLARSLTASLVPAELRVVDLTLAIRVPGTWRAVEHDWERGQVDDLRLVWTSRWGPRGWGGVELRVLSDDGHRAAIRLPSPGDESTRKAAERALRAALGLGPDVDWGPPGPGPAVAVA